VTARVATPVTLRAMRWWDIELVLPWEQLLFPQDPWTAAGFWSELAGVPETRSYLLADVDGELAGYGGLMCVSDAADIQTIAVVPHHQGRGVGRALLEALMAEAARRGVTTVMLEVRSDNAPAIALYESHGFDRQAHRRNYYGPGHDAVVMRRRLTR
jgi:[ribosomal protein S18]-alanine N-acetyltransferase